jgi:hypothetical protein
MPAANPAAASSEISLKIIRMTLPRCRLGWN